MAKAKKKLKTWFQLKDNKCPNGHELQKGMFGDWVGCICGFIIKEGTKDILVKRDHHE